MANGYGSSSSSSSSARRSSSTPRVRSVGPVQTPQVNLPPQINLPPQPTPQQPLPRQAQGSTTPVIPLPVAPAGYHYMPNGQLMSDIEHQKLFNRTNDRVIKRTTYYNPYERDPTNEPQAGETVRSKIINKISLNTFNIPESGVTRSFEIIGTKGAEFSLEVKQGALFYNFITNKFESKVFVLKNKIKSNSYEGKIIFPKVAAAKQYSFRLFADGLNTKHSDYIESRFKDGTIDINSSHGSNSLLLEKIAYQPLNSTIELSAVSPNSVTAFGGIAPTDVVTSVPQGSEILQVPFSVLAKSGSGKAFKVLRNPRQSDMMAFVTRNIGTAVSLPGENIYPTATAAFTGDDVNGAITSGVVVRMDNTDLSAVISVGDKITTPVTTDTVNGARDASAVAVTMDAAVATKMAVGDQVTGNAALDAGVFTVASLDSTNVFSLSSAVAIADGVTLTFSSKINRSLTTVTVVETSGTATDFTMSQAIQFRDNAPLTFFNQMNYSWTIDNTSGLQVGMVPKGGNITASTRLSNYRDTYEEATRLGGTTQKGRTIPAVDNLGKKPTISRNASSFLVTNTQTGNITFNKQQKLLLAGDEIKIYGEGLSKIKALTDWDLKFRDLKATIISPTTTTTQAVSSSATVTIASGDGIMDDVSTVSGIGIKGTPTVTTIGSYSGTTATITFSTPQTLENGVELNFNGAGEFVEITGMMDILYSDQIRPDWNGHIYFDVERFITATVET